MPDGSRTTKRAAVAGLRTPLVAFVLAAVFAPAGAAEARSKARADLSVARVTASPSNVPVGGRLQVRAVVTNAGRVRARASQVGFRLSRDRRAGKGDAALRPAARVGALSRKRRAQGAGRPLVPASLVPGRYHVIACADRARRVRERNERNNCRATKAAVSVMPAAAGGPAAGTAPPASSGGGATAPGAAAAGGAPPASPGFIRPANPLTVTPALDTARAVKREMTQYGGTLSATGADGTRFTLTLPRDALLGNELITMTPVSGIADLPLSKGLMGAVELKPHGLQLSHPATLTIDPPGDDPPVADQTAFLAHEGGSDFHLFPVGKEQQATLRLTHFSTPGVGLATPGDRAAVAQRPGARPLAQLEQALSEFSRAQRSGEPGPSLEAVQPPLLAYYDEVVRPQLERAETSERLAQEALAQALGWARQLALLGLSTGQGYADRESDMWARVERVVRHAIVETSDRCVRENSLPDAARLLGWSRQAALLSIETDGLQRYFRCARFEIDFDSVVTTEYYRPGETQTHEGAGRFHVVAKDMLFGPGSQPSGPLLHDGSTFRSKITYQSSSDCTLVKNTELTRTEPGKLTAFFKFASNPIETPPGGTAPPREHELVLYAAGGREYYQSRNEGCSSHTSESWDTKWSSLFSQYRAKYPFDLTFDATDQVGPLLMALRSSHQEQEADGSKSSEETFVEVWHRPQP